MKFSIIVPIYNVEKYIKRCIESVLTQKYNDFELILVNDGTKDNSMDVVKKLLYSSSLEYTIIDQENGGQGSARNQGIRISKGEFLVFLDSDDYISNDLLERVNQVIESENADMICYNSLMVDEDGKLMHKYDMCRRSGSNISCIDSPDILLCPPAIWNKVCRRDLFLKTDCWFLEGQIYEDTLVSRALMSKAKSITFIDDYLYYYVQRCGSTMYNTGPKLLEIIPANEQLIKWFKKNNIFEKYYYELQSISINTVLFYALDIINMNSKDDSRQNTLVNFISSNYKNFEKNPYLDNSEKKKVKLLLSYQFNKYYFRFGCVKKLKLLMKKKLHL